MRFVTCVSFVVVAAIILLDHAPCIEAGWQGKLDKKDKQKLKDILNGQEDLPADMALFVKYKNIKGKRFAKRWSKNGKFDRVMKRNVVALHPNNRTALDKMMKYRNIEYVEPVHTVYALPLHEQNYAFGGGRELTRRLEESVGYGINLTQASELWDIPPASDITICVIDSGYGLGHSDLPNLDQNITGTSTAVGDWFMDSYGHGTHVAGIIGAIGNNKEGVVGVMRDPTRFKFHIGRMLDGQGFGKETDLLTALEGCIDANAKVISLSIGIQRKSTTVETACKAAYDDGILIVSAAGNDGSSAYSYPASYPCAMSVAAVGEDMRVASFSNYNDQVEIAGPGVDILSTVTSNNGQKFDYDLWSGTSMATPFVAGVAALVWSYFPDCSNNQIRNVLIRTAKKNDDHIGCSDKLGFGVVHAKDAHDLLKKERCDAGNASPNPLSDGAIGGCSQDPQYVPPPTSAPTAFICEDKVFLLELTTDEWGVETSWELRNSKNKVVGSGDGYYSSAYFVERICLPPDIYTFTIRDSGGDGLCCIFGEGEYSVYYDGTLAKSGGQFTDSEVFSFGHPDNIPPTVAQNPSQSPTSFPTPGTSAVCEDDTSWFFTNAKGKKKLCTYLEANRPVRCNKMGVNKEGNETLGYESCPVSCDSCPLGSGALPASPSQAPTTPQTIKEYSVPPTTLQSALPMHSPTTLPSSTPTMPQTLAPTSGSTLYPTATSTRSPSALPSTPRSASPTLQLTMPATESPTLSPTTLPSNSVPPTVAPNPLRSPTAGSSAVCEDDTSWYFTNAKGKRKLCPYLEANRPVRCNKLGINKGGNETLGYESCPVSCDSCPQGSEGLLTSPASTPTISQPTYMLSVPRTTFPSASPMHSSTPLPTSTSTLLPTFVPTSDPTLHLTTPPTKSRTASPMTLPTAAPTLMPRAPPTESPTLLPTTVPSSTLTMLPTLAKTFDSTLHPTFQQTGSPTASPTTPLTVAPTSMPSALPTESPTLSPTAVPSSTPTMLPTLAPTFDSTSHPMFQQTGTPTASHTTPLAAAPTSMPSARHIESPTLSPTTLPSSTITIPPTLAPTFDSTLHPTATPTRSPSASPSTPQSESPTLQPIMSLTESPTLLPATLPSSTTPMPPMYKPISRPTGHPTATPAKYPAFLSTAPSTAGPTHKPSQLLANSLTVAPSVSPSLIPTTLSTVPPTIAAASQPTLQPTAPPTTSLTAKNSGPSTTYPSPPQIQRPAASSTVLPTLEPSYALRKPKTTTFQPTQRPTQTPSIGCRDNESWIHKTPWGKNKHCDYVAVKPRLRCGLEGVVDSGKITTGRISCPKACNTCPNTPETALQPSLSPTQQTPQPPISENRCCSYNLKSCVSNPVCQKSKSQCEDFCKLHWIDAERPTCIARGDECTQNENACCSPSTCQGFNKKFKLCKL